MGEEITFCCGRRSPASSQGSMASSRYKSDISCTSSVAQGSEGIATLPSAPFSPFPCHASRDIKACLIGGDAIGSSGAYFIPVERLK